MKLLDLNDVRTFAAAAEAGTLSGAAKELAVPPSTISRALTRLERHLGVLLVQRSSRGLSLTDVGQEYLQTCRRAFGRLRRAGGGENEPLARNSRWDPYNDRAMCGLPICLAETTEPCLLLGKPSGVDWRVRWHRGNRDEKGTSILC